jgi:hypothetical protein
LVLELCIDFRITESLKKERTTRRFAPTALMLGNFVTGCSIVGPAGMLLANGRGRLKAPL